MADYKDSEIVIQDLLENIQKNIYNKAKEYQQNHITEVNSYEEFKKVLDEKGGFVSAPSRGDRGLRGAEEAVEPVPRAPCEGSFTG